MKLIKTHFLFIQALVLLLSLNHASSQNINDSLKVLFKFDGNIADSSGNGFTITNYGATLCPDRNGNQNHAFYFDGNNDYMGNSSSSFLFTDEYTFSCWLKIDAIPSNGDFFIALDNGGQTKDNGLQIARNSGYHGIGAFTYRKNSQTNSFHVSTGIDTSSWHHYAISRSYDSIILYIDGFRNGSSYIGDYTGYSGSNMGFYIGNRHGTQKFFKGKIDEVGIWSRPLSSSEILTLSDTSSSGTTQPYFPSSVCIDYKFQNNTLDSGGQAYHLTNNGGTFTTDRFGNANAAISLDGVNDYLVLNNADSFNTGQFTISAWVKPAALPANGTQKNIVCFGDQTFDHGLNFAYNYFNTWDGFTGYSYNATSGNASAYDSAGNITININDWYHVAVARDDSVLKFFINGQLIETDVHYQDMGFSSSGNKLWIGARYGSGSFFNGAIDDVHICDAKLDDSTIINMYQPINSTRINKSLNKMSIRLFPNPSEGTITIQKVSSENLHYVQVTNVLGQNIFASPFNGETLKLNLSEKGLYFIHIYDSNRRIIGTEKILIK